jgi:NitT/TauT family transport system permease protein
MAIKDPSQQEPTTDLDVGDNQQRLLWNTPDNRGAFLTILSQRRGVPGWKVLAVLGVLVGLWYLDAAHYNRESLSFLMPSPTEVWKLGLENSQSRAALLTALWHTVTVVFAGLALSIVIGIAWAMLMAQAKWAEQALFPYAVVLQCVPVLALVPLIGAIEGYAFKARLVVTVIIALFPMVANTLFGLQSVDKAQRELFKLAGASRLTTLRKLLLPAAMPSIFVGLRTSAGLAVIGAVVGDQLFQRGTPGLGALIQLDLSRLLGPQMYAAILTAAALGVVIFLLFGLLGRLAVGKWHDFG